jgi:hypothetical protein
MSGTAAALVRALKRKRQHKPEAVEGDFAQAVARKLESRGIVCVPGLPADEEPEWFDVAIEHHRRQNELASEREARRQAEDTAQETPQTTASILMGEIARAARRSPPSRAQRWGWDRQRSHLGSGFLNEPGVVRGFKIT